MLTEKTQIRVRYAETDQMGFVYYGHYAQYLELGRVDCMKKAGISYAQLEKQGIGLPVREMKITYYQAARYDELIEVETSIKDMPTNRIRFEYKIYREDTLLAEAETTLFCMDKGSLKPIRMPAVVQESLSTFFN